MWGGAQIFRSPGQWRIVGVFALPLAQQGSLSTSQHQNGAKGTLNALEHITKHKTINHGCGSQPKRESAMRIKSGSGYVIHSYATRRTGAQYVG